jgi:predicted nucleic acid-binding protein
MANPRRIYWDACVWIALIQQERIRDPAGKIIEDRYIMCRDVIAAAEHDQIEIATSTLSFTEVCKATAIKDQTEDKIAAYFENDYVLPINLDRAVGERARGLMLKGYSKIKPPDACHLASAAIANAEEMHTFDDKLLALDGKIDKLDGTKLRICKPEDTGSNPMPLLDAMKAPQVPASALPPPSAEQAPGKNLGATSDASQGKPRTEAQPEKTDRPEK